MNNLPKSYLIQLIIKKSDKVQICSYFKIKEDTSIEGRLTSFSKNKLIEYIKSAGKEIRDYAMGELDLFPLKSAPTLYIINIGSDIDYSSLEHTSKILVANGRCSSLFLQEDHTIRCIYLRTPLKRICISPNVYELAFGYEKRIETTEWDPNLDDYGETKLIYSLENALLWFSESKKQYAILACGDFTAVDPILKYLKSMFILKASLPDLTQDMLIKLTDGSKIKSATFSNILKSKDDSIDAKTITIYDEDLENKHIYDSIRREETREQRSGFYSSHPDLLRAGIGISRRYGRVWTPAHLNREELIRLSLGILSKLDIELEAAFKNNLYAFITYYSNCPVYINSILLTGQVRLTFDKLIYYIISAERSLQKKILLPNELIENIIKYKNKLKFGATLTYECNNCGTGYIKCNNCDINVDLIYENNKINMKCPCCKREISNIDYTCDCGSSNSIIDPISQLFSYPQVETLKSISDYFISIHPSLVNPGLFIINGNELVIINQHTEVAARRVLLEDLNLWKTRAHIHTFTASSISKIIHILGLSREKCPQHNYHPRRIDCNNCMQMLPTKKRLEEGNVCLLRAMGIPINMPFDGIHHGHEIADIIYTDQIDNRDLRIGIHVKSKSCSNPARGLGRSDNKIKGLYAQLYYTLYQIAQGQQHFDILGISIPNRISLDVTNSIEEILLNFGISFIVVDHECWIKIMGLVQENIETSIC